MKPTAKKSDLTRESEAAAEWVAVSALKPWAKNPRKNDPAVAKLAESIKRFGFGAPILARREDGEIIAGHTRLKAALKLGLEKVPVRYLDLDPADAHLLALADNRLGEIADWDDDVLSQVLADLKADGADLDLTGFSERELSQLLTTEFSGGGGVPEGDGEITRPEELQERWQVQLGDVWRIKGKAGEHRITCGDSTDAAVVARVMAGEQADMVWTDPPYGVAYVGKTADALTIKNDKLDEGKLTEFLEAAFRGADAHMRDGAAVYVAHPAGALHACFVEAIVRVGWRYKQGLCWVKDSMVLGHSDYHYKHEPIIYACKQPPSGRHGRGGVGWYGDDSQTTVFAVDRPKRSAEHPTMKPVELVQIMVRNSSPMGGGVLDPFSGSGTTMVASESVGRVCRAVELDPKFVAVALQRMADMGCEASRG